MRRTKAERRQYPRITRELPIKVAANGYDFATSTRNVSCVGTYCHIDKYVPPFTKVMIKLVLPIINNNSNKNYNVDCKGIVVRAEDEINGGFNVAIYFNEITEEQRKKISQYINQFLPH